MKIEMERRATHDETAAEMDWRGVVIENLEAEIERLREALKPVARAAKDAGIDPHDETFDLKVSHVKDMALDRGCFRLARAALETN